MSQPRRKKRSVPTQVRYEVDTSKNDFDEIITLPNPNDSGSDNSGSEAEWDEEVPEITYKLACKTYTEDQAKLEQGHDFCWADGEKRYPDVIEDNIVLKESAKKNIRDSEPVELSKTFFSIEIKQYIIDVLKYRLKYSKAGDHDANDNTWRVRALLKLFQRNILEFGVWRTALSIDEMMAKSYARTSLKQLIRGKPIRFGLKLWDLCTSDVFVLCFDLYCGKNSKIGVKFSKCALGSRVVMDFLKPFFNKTAAGKISQFHLYFDNYFTNLDLIVHLRKLGLKCTSTIRDNRVKEKNVIDKRTPRGKYVVKQVKNGGLNYIIVVDSKPVLIVPTASGVTRLLPLKRYSSQARSKVEIPFPKAFHLYNKFMGGVDLHDGHCINVLPSIRSKKWTWVVFMRLIQASIVNTLVIYNASEMARIKLEQKNL